MTKKSILMSNDMVKKFLKIVPYIAYFLNLIKLIQFVKLNSDMSYFQMCAVKSYHEP